MIGQSLTTRNTKERLEALKKILPLRDSIRKKLQQRQLFQTDFTEGSEQLFKPIVSATEGVKTAISKQESAQKESFLPVLEKIAKRTKQSKKSLKTLPGDIITAVGQQEEERQRKLQEEIEREEEEQEEKQEQEEEGAVSTKGRVSFRDKIKPDIVSEIQEFQFKKPSDYIALGELAVKSYNIRGGILKDEYKDSKVSKDDWYIWIYKMKKGIKNLTEKRKEEQSYIDFQNGIKEAVKKAKSDPEFLRLPKQSKPGSEIKTQGATGTTEKTGSGLVGNSNVTCPGNILGDIARLEVLVGGKRAGNNSPEIINEAADICRRLFQGGIMDIATYRDFIEELVENFHGYHSD